MYSTTAYTTVQARRSLHQQVPPPQQIMPQMIPSQPPPQQAPRTQFSEALRQYVQRAFAEANNIEGIQRVDIEAKLKQVISQAAERGELQSIDWDHLLLPQQMIQAERGASYMAQSVTYPPALPLNLHTTNYARGPESPRKRKSGDLSVDDSQPSPSPSTSTPSSSLPPWRQRSGQFQSLDSRITPSNKRQRNGSDSPSKPSQGDLDREKRRQRFQNSNGKTVGNRELDPEHITLGPVVGRCQTLEKKYLRLTAAPNPDFVRPLEVLRKTLELLKNKWRQEGNYTYICDQFKSLRQDLTVQHIKDDFTVSVYEIHARIALEKGDLGEYNQCQSQLRTLYEQKLGGHAVEFQAYRILYFIYTCNRTQLSDILAELTAAEKREPAIKHALGVRSAIALGNYHRFFKLYLETPNMGGYLMDKFVSRERLSALAAICKTYKPDVGLRFITEELAFESDADAAKFICEHGGQDFLEEREQVRFLTGKVGNLFDLAAKDATKHVDLKGQL